MTCTHTWRIDFTDASGATNLTSYVLGFQIDQRAAIGQIGTANGQITLDNNTGIFTPACGGTYENFAWFNKIVQITCAINDGSATSTADVFHGIVLDARFNDDGTSAIVELRIGDFFSYAGRDAVSDIDETSASFGTLDAVIQDIVNGTPSGVDAVPFPKFGATNSTVTAINKQNNVDPAETATYPIGYAGIIDTFETGTARDYINQQILPSGPALAYPTTATYDGSAAKWTLNAAYLNRLLTKESVE